MKGKISAFALGLFLAWAGLPPGLHFAYWVMIMLAFFAGWRLHP